MCSLPFLFLRGGKRLASWVKFSQKFLLDMLTRARKQFVTLGISTRDALTCTQTLYVSYGCNPWRFTKPSSLVIMFLEWVLKYVTYWTHTICIMRIVYTNNRFLFQLNPTTSCASVLRPGKVISDSAGVGGAVSYVSTCALCLFPREPGWAIQITDNTASTLACACSGLFHYVALWLRE